MSKILIIIGVVIFILVGTAFGIKYFVGDIRPAVFPASPEKLEKSSTQSGQTAEKSTLSFQTEEVPFNLSVNGNFNIALFKDQIGKVRDLTFSPEGTLLASVPGEGRVIALVVEDQGIVEKKIVVDELAGPHGIAFYNDKLFIAEENRLGRYGWNASTSTATFEKELFKLPGGGHDAHTIVFGKDGSLYVKVGSVCNVCKETDPWRATIIKSDAEGNDPKVFATGLRNAAFITLNPENGNLWATENGRDQLGDDLPPEEVNIIQEGKNYGWPICYGNKVHDSSFDKNIYARNPCEDTEAPTVLMQAHSAPLGLSFIPESFAKDLNGDLLVAYHGSWNRSTPTGYKVVRVNIDNGQVKETSDFLTGFINGSSAIGRPVDLEFDKKGNLFVSDDKYGAIYVISSK